jgi:hypothetical protein
MAAEQSSDEHHAEALRYLEAGNVRCPAGTLADLSVRTRDDEQLGAIDGVLLDPIRRRLRYFVVESPARLLRRRYLLCADAPARFECDGKLLRVDADADDLERQRFDERSIRRFSDDDVITAMFADPAA